MPARNSRGGHVHADEPAADAAVDGPGIAVRVQGKRLAEALCPGGIDRRLGDRLGGGVRTSAGIVAIGERRARAGRRRCLEARQQRIGDERRLVGERAGVGSVGFAGKRIQVAPRLAVGVGDEVGVEPGGRTAGINRASDVALVRRFGDVGEGDVVAIKHEVGGVAVVFERGVQECGIIGDAREIGHDAAGGGEDRDLVVVRPRAGERGDINRSAGEVRGAADRKEVRFRRVVDLDGKGGAALEDDIAGGRQRADRIAGRDRTVSVDAGDGAAAAERSAGVDSDGAGERGIGLQRGAIGDGGAAGVAFVVGQRPDAGIDGELLEIDDAGQ